mgnify:CR=1 FL=1
MDVRSFITWAGEKGALIETERAVDPHLELARVMCALDGQAVLFHALTGFSGWRAVAGVCARREHFAAALGCTVSELIRRMADALAHPSLPPAVSYTHLTLPTKA